MSVSSCTKLAMLTISIKITVVNYKSEQKTAHLGLEKAS